MRKIVLSLSLLFLFVGCIQEPINKSDAKENLEALWSIIDQKYCFFEYKNIDWDEVRLQYLAKLQTNPPQNQMELFDLLGAMLAELKDGHVNLTSSFDMSRYWNWSLGYPENFSWSVIQQTYLPTNYRIAGGMRYAKLKTHNKIGYIYYNSFTSTITHTHLDYILSDFSSCDGLIIDVRNNGGGSLSNVSTIASHFITQKTLSGYIQHKTGTGHTDFSALYPTYLTPASGVKWLKPVVILTNRSCYSATNNFVAIMDILPQVTLVGDVTGGGSGLPFSSEIPIGWLVRFSASPILNAEKEHTEFGIDPDIKINMSDADKMRGLDTILEKAITQLIE